jgi:hypothetical protein
MSHYLDGGFRMGSGVVYVVFGDPKWRPSCVGPPAGARLGGRPPRLAPSRPRDAARRLPEEPSHLLSCQSTKDGNNDQIHSYNR